MHKPSHSDTSTLNTDTHSSKKWFSKISLKIPKKLKNGKSTSTLSNALHNAKKNNNHTLENTLPLSKCNPDSSISVQTVYESSNENTSLSGGTFLVKDGMSVQSSQLTINSTKNESTIGSSDSNLNLNQGTPIICISPIPSDHSDQQKDTQTQTQTQTRIIDVNSHDEIELNSNTVSSMQRTSSGYINTPVLRPRSYSDTPVPARPSMLYADDDFITDNKFYESSVNGNGSNRSTHLAPDMILRDNYYLDSKEVDLYDIKTPVNTSRNTPVDTSNISTPSNTIIGKNSIHNTSVNTTPVLKHREYRSASPTTPDRKIMDLVEAMQQKSCDNMTAKEFALAVGINYRCEESDSSDEDEDIDDKNSICTLSSTLSQLTANGKIPTANEIYNALSVNKSLGRQRRKHSAPILNLDMFIPPTPGECVKSASSCSLGEYCSNKTCTSTRTMGDLSHKVSNSKLEKKLPPCISTTNKSTESSSTCINSKYSSSSSIHSSHSGNTTTYMSDLQENDFDSCYSSSLCHQPSLNGCSPDFNGKNNISTTFYSLPRVNFHSSVSTSSICASKSTNSIPKSSYIVSNYNNSYRDMGMGCNVRRHSRVASSISINSQSSSVKKAPSSPRSITPSPVLQQHSPSKMNASDSHNMYINSKTIATSNATAIANASSPSTTNYPTSSSWSNGLSDIENLRFAAMPSKSTKIIESSKASENNKVKVYTKGRFTITHETYNHNRSTPSHKFEVEKN